MKYQTNSIISIKGQPHIWQITKMTSPINVVCRLVENTTEIDEYTFNPRICISESDIEMVLITDAHSDS
jgi:hypothetical protein